MLDILNFVKYYLTSDNNYKTLKQLDQPQFKIQSHGALKSYRGSLQDLKDARHRSWLLQF